MKSIKKYITICLESRVARWLWNEAANKRISVSRLLGDILKERMQEKEKYEIAMRRALARRPFLDTDGDYPSREDVHSRTS